ncbi:hypothetical protein EJ03DRAFT_296577 [Teratosphaeria nubilosa]|uniref:R3H domain-containing protein n=1 Tax=Teratosphaeria nubilosa TaxID=161662 RepID=A0A6G1L3N0_9PEZI|nr:hypothetical protein EJ03DRAFT_296577 [Teratosphaeria nubilosa]
MDSNSTTTASNQSSTTNGGRNPPRQRGSRRGRGGSRGNALAFRPASVAPGPAASTTARAPDQSADSRQSSGRGRGRGGRPPHDRIVNGRQFGGSLTQNESPQLTPPTHPGQLQGDAPAFVPGQTQAPKPRQRQTAKMPQSQRRRLSKSQAPDIATRTHEDIDNGHYECLICISEVQRKSKVWACHTCWTVFHLSCIKKWSTNEGSAAARQQEQDDMPPPRQWRCPGCNLPKDDFPKHYNCWCEKEMEPRPPTGIPPHSCGQTCGKTRAKKCPHRCDLTCHAGPCPPCSYMGPTQMCFCGKHEVTKKCSETNYEGGWSCGEVCGKAMRCGQHTCPRPCHDGECGACEERVPARCYCGQVEKAIICAERAEPKKSGTASTLPGEETASMYWIGQFDCGNTCGRLLDCQVHSCQMSCHPQERDRSHCSRAPDVVTHCSCGKTPLSELSGAPRTSCSDPIPSCSKPCGNLLRCGHVCESICHTGPCGSCRKIVDISCRCGRVTSKSVCHQGAEEPPQCARVCRTLLSCGRHNCDERCCSGESTARERQSAKRKHRPLNSAARPVEEGFEAEHICTRQCGRTLKCGIHVCSELCHKGQCNTCREAIFEEIACHCGKTVLQPPLPCGTKPPLCRFPCNRRKHCGHPQTAHNCHGEDEACPKCPFLVEKRCLCGKHTLKNQPCWLQDARCGKICDKSLRCGSHFCRKECHRPGDCEDANGQACLQPCGKPKKICGHADENQCHAPYPCKEDTPCQSKIYITCACQAQKQELKCGASKSSDGNGGKSLPCNDECARLERNRKLALALNIDQSTHVEARDHIPYSADTINLFAEKPKWSQTQEREFRVFAASDGEKRMRFKPMRASERAFIHALAEDFGLDSESMDPEPNRHVMIWKTPRFVSAPNKTLAEALRIRAAQRSMTTSANLSDNKGTVTKVKASNDVGEPYNSFVISNPRFGLTVDELRVELNSVVHPAMAFAFDIEFLPSEEVVLKATSNSLSSFDLQGTLEALKPSLVAVIASKGYGTAELCSTDSSLDVLRRESDNVSNNGWSRVAAKKAAPRAAPQASGIGGVNSFAALTGGGKVTFAAKKKPEKISKAKPIAVVDDWEAAELAAEEKERASSGDEEGGVPAGESKPAVEVDSNTHAHADASSSRVSLIEQDTGLQEGYAKAPIQAPADWASQIEAAQM